MKRLQRYVVLLVALWGGLWYVGLGGSSRLNFSSRSAAINLQSGSNFTIGSAITGFDGQLVKNSGATIAGSSITFDKGTFEENGGVAILDGTLSPATSNIALDGNKTLRVEAGQLVGAVSISGVGNRIEGRPIFTSEIVFGPDAELTLAVQTPINQNLSFEGASAAVFLESDVRLVDGVKVEHDATINLDGRMFSFGGLPVSLVEDIDWHGGGEVHLWASVELDSAWNFNDDTVLNGNGTVLSVEGGGELHVAAGKTLRINDLVIQGIGTGSFGFGDATSSIRFSNVTIISDSSASESMGLFYIDGPTTFVPKGETWHFGGSSKLTINHVTLWIDGAGDSSIGGFTFDGPSNYSFYNSGTYRVMASGGRFEDWVEQTSDALVVLEGRVSTNESNISINTTGIATNQSNITSNESDISDNADDIEVNATNIGLNETKITNNSNAIVAHETRLDTAESNISTNASDISTNQGNISTNQGNISTNATNIENNSNAIVAHEVRLDTAESNISTNASDISTNQGNISTNQGNISSNATNIENNSDAIAAHETRLDTAESNISTNQGNISTNQGNISTNAMNIENNSNAVVAHETRLDTAESNISTNAGDISTNQGNISTNQGNISTNATNIENNSNAIAAHEVRLDTAESNISTNASDISTNQGNISTNQGNISTNATNIENNSNAIAAHESRLDTAESNISTNASDISTNQGNISTNQGNISTNATNIENNSNAIVANENRLDTAESNISTNQGDISTNQGNISTNATNIENNSNAIVAHETRLDTAESNISTNQGNISTNQTNISNNDTDILNNSNAIVAHETRLDTAESNISTNASDISTNQGNISTNQTNISNNDTDILNNSNAIVAHETRLDTAESNISTNASDISTNQGNISTNQGNISTNATNIENNSNAVAAHETRLDAAESNISTNASDISTNQGDISTNQGNISTNQTNISNNDTDILNNSNAIAAHETRLDTAESNISTNASDISTNQGNISTNQTNISNNDTDILNNSNAIAAHETRLDTAESNISTNASDISANQGNISTNQTNISSNDTDILNNSNAIAAHETRLDTAESNISTNASDISTNQGNISTNQGDISTNATNIENNSHAIVAHETRLDAAESDISTNAGDISTNQGNISTNQGNISTNATNIENNSNAIAAHETRLDTAESNISTNASDISTNQGDISTNETNIENNSNAIVNTWELTLDNSEAINFYGPMVIHNSNVIVSNSFDIIYQNSLAIHANKAAITNNSNSIVANHQAIMQNSDAILANRSFITSNSNAVVTNYQAIINNSNAVFANRASIYNNSGAIVANQLAIINNSNAMEGNRESIINNSDAIVANQLAIINNSNAMVVNKDSIINNSNAIMANRQAIVNNSNAIIEMQDEVELVVNVSNVMVVLEGRVTTAETDIVNNSNAIVHIVESGGAGTTLMPGESMSFDEDETLDGEGKNIVFSHCGQPQFIVGPGVTLTLQNISLLRINKYTFQMGSESKLLIGENVLFELSDDVVWGPEPIELMDENTILTVRGVGGRKHLTFISSCHYKNLAMIIGAGSLQLENVELSGLHFLDGSKSWRNRDFYLTGGITLGGEAIVNAHYSTRMNFVAKGNHNELRLRRNNIALRGDLAFGNLPENTLHIKFLLEDEGTVTPRVRFENTFALITSQQGWANLIFDDPYVQIYNETENSFVLSERSLLEGYRLEVLGNPIKQISRNIVLMSDLEIMTELDNAIEQEFFRSLWNTTSRILEEGTADPKIIRDSQRETEARICVESPEVRGGGRHSAPREGLEPRMPEENYDIIYDPINRRRWASVDADFEINYNTIKLSRAKNSIWLNQGTITDFGVSQNDPLVVTMVNGATLRQGKNDATLKYCDELRIQGRGNKIIVANNFTINGRIQFDTQSDVTFEFDPDASNNGTIPTVIFACEYEQAVAISKGSRLKFTGKGNVLFQDGSVLHLEQGEFYLQDSAELLLESNGALYVTGKGKFAIDNKARLCIENGQQVIFGLDETDSIELLVDRQGEISVSGQLSLKASTYAVEVLRQGAILVKNGGVSTLGGLSEFVLQSGGILRVDEGGLLKMSEQETSFTWDNRDGEFCGDGLVGLGASDFVGQIQELNVGPVQLAPETFVSLFINQQSDFVSAVLFSDQRGNRKLRTKDGVIVDLLAGDQITGENVATGAIMLVNDGEPFAITAQGERI